MITVAAISRSILPAIAEMEADLFEKALTLSVLKSLFDGPAFTGHISFEEEKICGYVLAHLTQGHVEIISLGTVLTHRRRGHADHLLATLIAKAQDSKLFLEVAVDNEAALNLYRKNGFSEVGRRPGYYRRARKFCDAVVMRRN